MRFSGYFRLCDVLGLIFMRLQTADFGSSCEIVCLCE